MEQLLDKSDYITDKSQLVEYFCKSFKSKSEFKIGTEFEKIGVNSETLKAVPYSGKNGISEFLKTLKLHGKYTEINENNTILGLKGDNGDVTLEPGSQFEFSTKPFKELKYIDQAISDSNKITALLAENLSITWIGSGIQPLSTFDNIEMIPKKRYDIMKRYLPTKGSKALTMMSETAGIQTSVDYESEKDAIKKLKVSLGISPILTAIFVNSPLRGGKLNGYKSYRASGWLNTDNDRCGLISSKIFEDDFSFADYVDVLLDVPMFFIERQNQHINATGLTFKNFLKNGLNGHKATMDDWMLHMSTFFPEVRLKNYLEMRNCDCQRADMAMGFTALAKGIMYNEDSMNQAWSLVKNLSWAERNEIRNLVPQNGLDTQVNNFKVLDIAKELVSIAEFSLKSGAIDESVYLERAKELVFEGKTPADIIIKNWNSSWNQDIRKFVEYSKLT